MSNGSCSHQICVFTRRPTWARSPTAVISAPISSPTTLCCMLTRGPTPKRRLSTVSTVKKLSTTVGTSVVTLWARALHVPRVSLAFCSLGSLKSHQETHSEPLTQDPARRVQVLSAPRRKFTMICHFCNTKGGWHVKSFGGYSVRGG